MWLWRHREHLGIAVLAALAISFLCTALWLTLSDRSMAAATAGVLGLLLLAFVRLSRFKKFRGLGFEAELWDDKQAEAERLISQTKGMLTLFGKTLVTAVPRMNRMMQAFTVPDQIVLANDVERMLRDYGVADVDLKDLYSEIDRWHAWDITSPICKAIRFKLEAQSRTLHQGVSDRFGSPIKDIEGFNKASSEASAPLQHVFSQNDLMSVPPRAWEDEIKRRVVLMPLSTETKQELLNEIDSDMRRLNEWTGSRLYTERQND